ESLVKDWSDLLAKSTSNTIFLTRDWHQLWWRLAGEGELVLLSVRDGDRLIGLAPLIRSGNRWEFAGGAEIADFLDVVADPAYCDEVASAVLDYLGRHGGTAEFRNLRPESVGATGLLAGARRRGMAAAIDQEDVSPKVELPEDWESYL